MGLQNEAFCYASGKKSMDPPPKLQGKNQGTPPKLQGKNQGTPP